MREIGLDVPFLRSPRVTVVLGPRLDRTRVGALRRRLAEEGRHIHWTGRGRGLWVELAPGTPPAHWPAVEDVAELTDAALAKWASVLSTYGLPTHEDSWWVGVTEPERDLYLVPLTGLHTIAWRARILLASAEAVRGKLDHLRRVLAIIPSEETLLFSTGAGKLPETDTELSDVAQIVVRQCLREALDGMVPGVSKAQADKLRWAFYAQGWWPMALLEFFIPPKHHLGPAATRCRVCGRRIPLHRIRRGAGYCGIRCKETAKKRRQRPRQRARRSPSHQGDKVMKNTTGGEDDE